MGFWKGVIQEAAGAALIAGGVLVGAMTFGAAAPLSALMISAGVGMVMTGIGTMLTKGPLDGFATASKNPTQSWNCAYGRVRVGGTLVYDASFGDENKYRDLVLVLEAHPCQSVDRLLFDQQRIQIDVTHFYTGSGAPGPAPVSTSFTPLQQDVAIFDIERVGNVVTVELHSDIPLLDDGDQVAITDVPGDPTLNGRYPVNIVSRVGSTLIFTYLSGGPASHVVAAGHCKTVWVDYGRKVYMETMLGTQVLGETFYGMRYGTPNDGSSSDLVIANPNPWTSDCSLVGKTAVFIRLHYNDAIFANGLPQISFHVSGKNDIYDPRTDTYGYTENAALCIADYLSNTQWGFKAAYGTEIPLAQLITAANICDEAVALAEGGTEPRYALCGGWQLTTRKGEVLQNLLTACAGRLTCYGGQFIIWPAAWSGVSDTISGTSIYSLLTSAFRWKTLSITDLYNGVKGTFISPVNSWQASDFPPYAQDVIHGYASDANLEQDGGDRRWFDIQLPFTISCPTAQRLAKIELMRRRQQGTGTFSLNMAAYQFTPMDVVAMDLPYFAWTAKELEILAVRFKLDAQQGTTLLGVEIDVQETAESVYAWSIGEELSPAGYQQALTPSTATPAPPTNVVLTPSSSGAIIVTWTAPADGYILNGGHIELKYQLVASPEGLWFSLAKMDPTVVQAIIPELVVGASYNVEIRAVNAAGIPSVWVVGTPAGSDVAGPILVQAGPYAWNPGYDSPILGDSMFVSQGFAIRLAYATSADGSASGEVAVWGNPPIAILSDIIDRPAILSAVVFGTGGAIPAGTYVFGISAFDEIGGGGRSALSDLVTVVVPLGSTNKITFTVAWPGGSFGGNLFVAVTDTLRGLHYESAFGVGGSTDGTTVDYDLTSILATYFGCPDANFDHLEFDTSEEIHAGSWALAVGVVGAATLEFTGQTFGVNDFADCDISLLAFADLTKPVLIANFRVLSNTADTITIGPNAAGVSPLDLTLTFEPGDVFVMRTRPTAFDADSFTDSRFINSVAPTGLTPDVEGGNLAYILSGTGAGQAPKLIAGNTDTKVTLATPWDIIPDATSRIVILAPAFTSTGTVKTLPLKMASYAGFNGNVATLLFPNSPRATFFIAAYSAGPTGIRSRIPAFREIFLPGSVGSSGAYQLEDLV